VAITAGAMACRCFEPSVALVHWTQPSYDPPRIPTRPFDHGWRPIHSCVSKPSLASLRIGV
jgi:hypothetical protein